MEKHLVDSQLDVPAITVQNWEKLWKIKKENIEKHKNIETIKKQINRINKNKQITYFGGAEADVLSFS